MKRQIRLMLSLSTALIIVVLMFSDAVVFASASVSLTPAFGPVGTTVTISGAGFVPSTKVFAMWPTGPNLTLSGTCVTTPSGGLGGCTFTVPAIVLGVPVVPGSYNVTVSAGISLAAALFTVTKAVVPPPSVPSTHSFSFTGGSSGSANAVNSAPDSTFFVNSSTVPSGTVRVNLVGRGGNDTFIFTAGNSNASVIYVATGSILTNNTFDINGTGNGNSTYSLISGPNSNFTIGQSNSNGTQTFAITGGVNSTVVEEGGNSTVPIWTTFYSINLGTNSSVILGSDFQGNASTVNVVF